jgi:MAM domain, meprin/A5/mu
LCERILTHPLFPCRAQTNLSEFCAEYCILSINLKYFDNSPFHSYLKYIISVKFQPLNWLLAIQRKPHEIRLNVDLFLRLVFYAKVVFGTGKDSAILSSPAFDVTTPTSLRFYYQITTTKIVLNIMVSTSSVSELKTVETLSYSNQSSAGAWNEAVVLLSDGLTRLVFVAVKTGVTVDRPFVAVDRISLMPEAIRISSGKK